MAPEPVALFELGLLDEDVEAVVGALRSGWLTMGPRTEAFEAEFAAHLGVAHAVALASGTAALHLAYLAAGVGPGDEVVVPGITFVATAAAVRHCGGEPVPAEVIGEADLSLDPEDAARRIGPRTKAVCAVHYGGYAAPLAELRALCEERGVALIEDAAHSPDASPPGERRRAGSFGLAAAFSFFSNKVLSCGEGGLLATSDPEVAELARSLRSHAMTSGTWDRHRAGAAGYDVLGTGFNYRLDEPRAALLSSRLPRLGAEVAERRRLTRRYRELLAELDGVLVPYGEDQVAGSSCYTMPVLIANPRLREPVRRRLWDEHRVQTSVLYPALSQLSAYRDGGPGLPRCERIAASQLSLPLHPGLGEERVERVVAALGESLAAAQRRGTALSSSSE